MGGWMVLNCGKRAGASSLNHEQAFDEFID